MLLTRLRIVKSERFSGSQVVVVFKRSTSGSNVWMWSGSSSLRKEEEQN